MLAGGQVLCCAEPATLVLRLPASPVKSGEVRFPALFRCEKPHSFSVDAQEIADISENCDCLSHSK
jgi:hypothetical protein